MSETSPLTIGTRGSALALVQARQLQTALRERGTEARLEIIVTEGDRRASDTAWGEGAFVGAIETALLEGRVDVAVHSAKDVPTDEDPRLTIAAFLPREDARDTLVTPADRPITGLDDVPEGARVGTDSPRRGAFLRALRPDLRIIPLHGNVDTRLRRLDEGDADVLVLAAAGLRRLGRADRISVPLPPTTLPSAPGQGALAVQVRATDEQAVRTAAGLDDGPTRVAVEAERRLLRATGGGCRSPIGAFAVVSGEELGITAGYARSDGSVSVIVAAAGSVGSADRLVEDLLHRIATGAARAATADRPARRVLVTRPLESSASTILALVDRGLAPVVVPAIAIDRSPSQALVDAVRDHAAFDWVVLTSANAVRAVAAAAGAAGTRLTDPADGGPAWAAVGEATAAALLSLGLSVATRPARATGADLADAVPAGPGTRVLLPRGDLADPALGERLRRSGADVVEVIAYRTVEAPPASAALLSVALADRPSAWIAASPSAVRGMLALAGDIRAAEALAALPLVAIGPTTAAEGRRRGLTVAVEADSPRPAAVADAAAALVRPSEVTA